MQSHHTAAAGGVQAVISLIEVIRKSGQWMISLVAFFADTKLLVDIFNQQHHEIF